MKSHTMLFRDREGGGGGEAGYRGGSRIVREQSREIKYAGRKPQNKSKRVIRV